MFADTLGRSFGPLPDGRSLVETIGIRPFRVLERGERDGYSIARVEFLHDMPGLSPIFTGDTSLLSSTDGMGCHAYEMYRLADDGEDPQEMRQLLLEAEVSRPSSPCLQQTGAMLRCWEWMSNKIWSAVCVMLWF